MKTEWVDFKRVKEAVSMQMVLDHYGIRGFIKRGDELRGACPIHKGSRQGKTFTVNLQKNAFKCFSEKCKAKGNILDFVAAKEGGTVRDAAVKLAEWFKVGESQLQSPKQAEDIEQPIEIQRGIYRDKEGSLYEVLANAANAENFERLVVHRELFGDYRFWIAPIQNFASADHPGSASFRLVKAL
jgi:hypothetical protein